jgi:hypothetical protein
MDLSRLTFDIDLFLRKKRTELSIPDFFNAKAGRVNLTGSKNNPI